MIVATTLNAFEIPVGPPEVIHELEIRLPAESLP
jgi:hypothetical protein